MNIINYSEEYPKFNGILEAIGIRFGNDVDPKEIAEIRLDMNYADDNFRDLVLVDRDGIEHDFGCFDVRHCDFVW